MNKLEIKVYNVTFKQLETGEMPPHHSVEPVEGEMSMDLLSRIGSEISNHNEGRKKLAEALKSQTITNYKLLTTKID